MQRTLFLILVMVAAGLAGSAKLAGRNSPLPPQEALQSPPVKTIRVNGTQLSYVEQGRGEAVILIHGFLHDYRGWSTQLPELSKRFRVIAYSMRHRWPNQPPSNVSDVSASVDKADLVAFMQRLGHGRVHLIGHSAGAALALRVARDHPDLVRSMVLGEPGPGAIAAENVEAGTIFSPERIGGVRQAYERGDSEGAVGIVREAVLGKEAAARPGPAWLRQIALDNAWQLQLLWTRGAPEPPVTCEEARLVRIPALLLGGDRSPALFGHVLDALEKCLPVAERAVLPESSHGLEFENPAAFNQLVLKFLSQHSTQPR